MNFYRIEMYVAFHNWVPFLVLNVDVYSILINALI